MPMMCTFLVISRLLWNNHSMLRINSRFLVLLCRDRGSNPTVDHRLHGRQAGRNVNHPSRGAARRGINDVGLILLWGSDMDPGESQAQSRGRP